MSAADNRHPLRVMWIIARLNVGGPAVQVIEMATRFQKSTDQGFLVCGTVGTDEGDMAYLAKSSGVKPIVIPALGRALHPLRDLSVIWHLFRLMKKHKPDVVHTHTAKAGFTGRIAAWLAGVPIIIHTFHGHVFHGYFGKLKTGLFIRLERLAARLSTRITTLSPALRDELIHTYRITSADKVEVLPLGLNLEPYGQVLRPCGAFRTAYQINPERPVIGIVGRLTPIKNHGLFVRAARIVADQLPEARFVIVGGGESRGAIEAEIASRFLVSPFIFTGWVRELPPVYADLDLTVVCSDNEGTPVALIEAMAAGCPVVATAVGGVSDLLDHGRLGQLVKAGDAEELADAILRELGAQVETDGASTAAEPDAKRKRAETAAIRGEICERFSLENMEQNLRKLYRNQK